MSEENPQDAAQNIPPEEIPQEQPAQLAGGPVNKETSDETLSSAAPIAEAEQLSTINPVLTDVHPGGYQPSTEQNMEVHHHTHPHHGKKSWKEYFWEFLMLFLAVFCGFLAEYQLEHKIEHDREEQFIVSLTSDLQDDIKNLDATIATEKTGIAQLDTLLILLDSPSFAKQSGDQLYYVSRMGPRSQPFSNNSRTFDQLRNSGGFRLIRNAPASNNITGYYGQFALIRLLEDNYNHEFDNYKKVAAKIFDPAILRRQERDDGEILRSEDNPSLRTYEPGLLKELAYHVLQMNGSRRSKLILLENLKMEASKLSAFLNKQYHLE